MYAMLTGNLPFTVEPFNIKTLHTKMIKGDINPIPVTLTRGRYNTTHQDDQRRHQPDPGDFN